MKKISEAFGRLKQAANGSVSAPEVKAYTDKVVPELSKIYKGMNRDRVNRLEIIKLLSQMGNPLANEIFLDGIVLGRSYDQQIFIISANALGRSGVVEALPKLLAAHESLVADRTIRGNSPFTNRENEIEEAVVNTSISILLKNPTAPERTKVVEVLDAIADTRDTMQDLRLNMKAVKGLGQIGDSASIPTLIRAIAMMGEVQKVGLGPFAFVSLQQIPDRNAVVEAIMKFARGKDAAFNDFFKEELQADPMLKVPVWPLQQSIDFLGLLNYSTPKVIEFLTAELNHNDPDDVDKVSAERGEGAQKFDAAGWATWRRNWAAVALSQLGHKPVLDVIKERFKLKKGKGGKLELDVTVEEAVGFLRAIGYLQYPEDSCPLLLDVAKTGSEALRDKVFYYGGIMCGDEFRAVMKEEHDKIDCKKMILERFPEDADPDEKKKAEGDCNTLKNRIKTYMDEISFAKKCGKDVGCFLQAATVKDNPNMEAAIYGAYRLARGDAGKSKQVVEALAKVLDNPVMAALEANLFALDRLTPNGDKVLIERAEQVRQGFVSQQAYKDRARLVEAFLGHLKARTK
ncbi:MAG: hypothetical protein PHU25_09035 [Deltaproteobacteria bacterium]|nr:hypothetical protein [Deltaproteobacteria bacterium]